jgi:uncharacterized delta-60 repeat protein
MFKGKASAGSARKLSVLLIGILIACAGASCKLPGGGEPGPQQPSGDTTSPTVTITSAATDPTGSSPIAVTIAFSEAVQGFDAADLTVTNGSAASFAATDGKTYTADLQPTQPEVSVAVDIKAGVCTDTAGNPNVALAQPFSRFYTQRPTVVISSTLTKAYTNISPVPITITFNKPVDNFSSTDVALVNCAIGNFTTTDSKVWEADLTPSGQGPISATVPEGVCNTAGSPSIANTASSTFSVTYDTIAPTVSLSSTEPDPTNSSIQISITFSESIDASTFTSDDITVSGGGSAGNLRTTNDIAFTADVTPGGQGSVIISLSAGVCQDRAGNGNVSAPSPINRAFDSVRPGVTLASGAPDPTLTSPIPVTITFTEPVSGFTVGDISVANGTAGNLQTSDDAIYTADVTPGGLGLVTINVAAGVCQDAAGNTNTAAAAILSRSYGTNAPGDLDTGFLATDPGTSSYVNTIAIQPDGKIVIGGDFTACNGATRGHIARLNADGTLDAGFATGAGADGMLNVIALQSDGKMFVGGLYNNYNGTRRSSMAKLDSAGALDTSFGGTYGAYGSVYAIAIQSDGKIVIGGSFTQYITTARGCLARLNTNGSVDTGFAAGAGANNNVNAVALQTDGKVIIGGDFTAYDGTSRGYIARLNADGTLDTGFDVGVGADNRIYALALQNDGKIIIAGSFSNYDGVGAEKVARLNADGSLDTSFSTGTGPSGGVRAVAIQADGKIVIAGDFSMCNLTSRGCLARLNANGTLDTGFLATGAGATNNPFAYLHSAVLQGDGKIIIGGSFTSYNGVARGNIARVRN